MADWTSVIWVSSPDRSAFMASMSALVPLPLGAFSRRALALSKAALASLMAASAAFLASSIRAGIWALAASASVTTLASISLALPYFLKNFLDWALTSSMAAWRSPWS